MCLLARKYTPFQETLYIFKTLGTVPGTQLSHNKYLLNGLNVEDTISTETFAL